MAATSPIPTTAPRPSRPRPRRLASPLNGWGLEPRVMLSIGPVPAETSAPRRAAVGAVGFDHDLEITAQLGTIRVLPAATPPTPATPGGQAAGGIPRTGALRGVALALAEVAGGAALVLAGSAPVSRPAAPGSGPQGANGQILPAGLARWLAGPAAPRVVAGPIAPTAAAAVAGPLARLFAGMPAATAYSRPAPATPGPGPWFGSGGTLPWRRAGSSRGPGGNPQGHHADDPVAMACAVLDGRVLIALLDPARGRIILRYGDAAPMVFRNRADGLDHPSGVALADLTGTGRLDLIVANSGGNDVLIYPGRGGGRFGPELHGGAGIPVGLHPVGITVADLNGDGHPDLLVANKGSNDLSVLIGQGGAGGANWTLTAGPRLPVGPAPVATVVQDFTKAGHPDILVANSGANDLYVLRGTGGGAFDVKSPIVLPVGNDPIAIFVGRFDRGPGSEVVAINKGSNDLTMISNFLGPDRVTQTIKAGGLAPAAALALDPNGSGVLDLVVANSGSGSFSLFKGGASGLELASTFSDPNLPSPTALAPVAAGGGQLEFLAGTAGQDTVDLLAFAGAGGGPGLATGGPALDDSLALEASPDAAAGDAVVAQLIPLRDSSLDAIALLITANRGNRPTQPDLDETPGGPLLLELATVPVGQLSPGAGAAADGEADAADLDAAPAGAANPAGPAARTPRPWTRFVLGVDEALDGNRLAPLDAEPDPTPGDAGPARVDPGDRSVAMVDEAIRGLVDDEDRPDYAEGPIAGLPPADPAPPAAVDPAEVAATASAAALFGLRLILGLANRRRPARWRRAGASPPHGGGRPDPEGRA